MKGIGPKTKREVVILEKSETYFEQRVYFSVRPVHFVVGCGDKRVDG